MSPKGYRLKSARADIGHPPEISYPSGTAQGPLRSNSEVAAIANHVCSTPTTDICALSEHFRFVKQTGLMHRSKTQSFDHLIGQLLNVCGDIEAKHPGGLQVDPQFDPRRLLHRKLAGLGSVQNPLHIITRTGIEVG